MYLPALEQGVEVVQRKAGGHFLYLHYIRPELQDASLAQLAPHELTARLDSLPHSYEDFYAETMCVLCMGSV